MDSGDLATGVAILDFIHPPGYPLFVLLAHGFWRALPGVSPAFATNLFCAVLGSVSCAIAFVAGRSYVAHLEINRASPVLIQISASLATALALASGALWWQQANLATVHAGNILLATLLVLCIVLLWQKPLTGRLAFLAGCVLGLATTHHLTLLGLPAAFFAAEMFNLRRWRIGAIREFLPFSVLKAGLAGTLIGLLPWAVLWWLGIRAPTHIWGDPTTFRGFLDVVLARQYHELLASPTVTSVAYRASRAIWTVARELGPVGFLVALGGLGLLWESDRRYVRFVLFSVIVYVVFFAFYSARDVESYLLPVAIAMVPALAHGLMRTCGWILDRWARLSPAIVVSAMPALVLIVGLALNASTMNLRGDNEALEYANAALAEAPVNAILITEGDRHSFALWYAHHALGFRPDVTIVDRWFLRHETYRAHLNRTAPDVYFPPNGELTGAMLASGAVSHRPIVVTTNDRWNTPMRSGKLLFEVVRSST